jgi:hypothetical protein
MAALLVLGTASAGAAETDAARPDPSPRFGTADRILTHVTTSAEGSRPAWGTRDRILAHVGFNEFVPLDPATPLQVFEGSTGSFGIYSSSLLVSYAATAHVPSGALLTYLELDYCDMGATGGVLLDLRRCTYLGDGCSTLSIVSSEEGLTGCHFVAKDLTPQTLTMDNNQYELVLVASLGGGDVSTKFLGAYIGYRLQLSVAPTLPTFGDVPTSHPYFRAIEALAASGITGGCGSGNFCPNQNLTRGEMAAFLARALGLHFPN